MGKSSNHILTNTRAYALYVCETRALPRISDGLKHGQRVALWALRNRNDEIKTMALTGILAAEKLYVHGDVSCSNAISMLAAPYKNTVPLIRGEGQFGTRMYPTNFGAPRYTSVARSKAAEAFLYNDMALVETRSTYDGTGVEPVSFLPLVPICLLNGTSGIAVGWSTNILPRNFLQLVDATIAILKGKKISTLQPYYRNYNVVVNQIAESQWEIEGAVTIVDASRVQITDLPPGMSIESFREKLIEMENIGSIETFDDNSSKSIDIAVRFKRGIIKAWKPADAIKFFKLKEKVTERLTVIDWNGSDIKTYSNTTDLITEFADWRLSWYEKRYQKYHDDASDELVYWKLLAALFKAGFTKKLGTFANRSSVEADILTISAKEKLKLVDGHLERAVSLPTYRWTKEFEAEVGEKIKELSTKIADYRDILAKPQRRREIYIAELEELRKLKF